MRISIIVPALNEQECITGTLRSLQELDGEKEIIVVDGGSSDQTESLARAQGARVLNAAPGRGTQMHAGALDATRDDDRRRSDMAGRVLADQQPVSELSRWLASNEGALNSAQPESELNKPFSRSGRGGCFPLNPAVGGVSSLNLGTQAARRFLPVVVAHVTKFRGHSAFFVISHL